MKWGYEGSAKDVLFARMEKTSDGAALTGRLEVIAGKRTFLPFIGEGEKEVRPMGMGDWDLPIEDRVLDTLKRIPILKKFEIKDGREGYKKFDFMWGGPVYTNPFTLLTKDNQPLGEAMAYKKAYYFDANGTSRMLIIPVAVRLGDGRVTGTPLGRFVEWGEEGWQGVKENYPEKYEYIFTKFRHFGDVGTIYFPTKNSFKNYYNKNSSDSIVAFQAWTGDPFFYAWESEIAAFLVSGDNTKLGVITAIDSMINY